MKKNKLLWALLCGGTFAMHAGELPQTVKDLNQFHEYRLGQGMIYEIYVKSGDGVTTVTFPSAISKIAGVNVATDSSSDFVIAAKPGSYYFNLTALKKGASGTLTVIHNRQTYILYLKQDDKKAFAAVNFAASSGGSSYGSGKLAAVSPARLLSLIDMTKGYEALKQRYPSDLRDTVHAKNHRCFNFGKFKIELLEVVRFNREDTLVFKLLMRNDTAEEITYDKFSFSAQLGGKTYYMSAADASGVMPPKSATWAFFTITGTPDGRRNNFAPDNEFMIGVTASYMENEYKIETPRPAEKTYTSVDDRLHALVAMLEQKIAEMEKQKNENKPEITETVPETPVAEKTVPQQQTENPVPAMPAERESQPETPTEVPEREQPLEETEIKAEAQSTPETATPLESEEPEAEEKYDDFAETAVPEKTEVCDLSEATVSEEPVMPEDTGESVTVDTEPAVEAEQKAPETVVPVPAEQDVATQESVPDAKVELPESAEEKAEAAPAVEAEQDISVPEAPETVVPVPAEQDVATQESVPDAKVELPESAEEKAEAAPAVEAEQDISVPEAR